MNASWRGCLGLLVVSGFALAGCNGSAASPSADAGRSMDLGIDGPLSTGGAGAAGRDGAAGEVGTVGSGGAGGTGGSSGTGGKGTASGGAHPSVDGGAGFDGGAGGAVTGGTQTGSGGTLLLGGSTAGAGGTSFMTGGAGAGGGSLTASKGGTSATGGGTVVAGKTAAGGSSTSMGGTGGVGTGGVLAPVCPDSKSYVGSSDWTDTLVVTAGAKYCGHFREGRTLEEEYAAKAKLSFAPGSYALPSTAGTYPFALPICFERRSGEPVPVFAGAGQAKAIPSKNTTIDYSANGLLITQPVTVEGSPAWTFSMSLSYFGYTDMPQPPVLDGSYLNHPSSGRPDDKSPGYLDRLELCDGPDCEDQWQDVRFEACSPDYPLQRHSITFAGGQIVLDMRITGEVGGSIMLAAFTAASGSLDGMAFTQTDYWRLVYAADHHHFTRNFAVLFDAPIGEVCGIKIVNFWGNRTAAPLPDVATIRCDLTTIAARTVSSATIESP